MLQWDDPISFIHLESPQQRRVLKTLELETVGKLLSLYPRRYDDYSNLVLIAKIPTGQPVTIKAKVTALKQLPTFRRRFVMIKGMVEDESGSIPVTWFNQPWLVKQLLVGDEIFISGTVTMRPRLGRGFTSPLWEPVSEETLAAGNVAPVYPLHGSITQKTLRKIMRQTMEETTLPEEYLDLTVLKRVNLVPLSQAYRFVHRPETIEQTEQGRRRFAFQELLVYQLALRTARKEADRAGAPMCKFDESFAKTFVSGLPFELTADQKKAVWSAVKDIQSDRPMRRLLQGDVGSGKTVVAAMLAALVYRSGGSAVFMAPTDLLAKQHLETFRRLLVPYQIPVLLMTSSSRLVIEGGEETKLNAESARERLSHGRVIAIGTHALLEQGQSPPDVVLAVVDEQHRFGVAQREALVVAPRQDGKVPHLLSMSATPIPRSLSLTMLGDLDVSIIKTKPLGRLPIQTHVYVGASGRDTMYALIQDQISQGHRVFIVCPLIDPSDTLGVKSVEAEMRRLQTGPLMGRRIGMLHGKMPVKDKDAQMQSFANGELDVLVATTVVEVGVDVPEATVIAIEGAERFGLAQLHQLRGRVGRSTHQSYCLLMPSDDAFSVDRLRILERTTDGFVVAEEDLKLRGQGNILGTQQSGQAMFEMARIDDFQLMKDAKDISKEMSEEDVKLEKYPKLKEQVEYLQETTHRE